MSWETEVIVGREQEFPTAMVAVRMATGERVRYVPERTCHSIDPTDSSEFFICSNCNHGAGIVEFIPKYCPNCGRRVVKE